MTEKQTLSEYQEGAGLYEIRLKGELNDRWTDWLGEVTITLEEDGNTLLTCRVIDQAALHGLLKRVRDLGLPLLSINFVSPRQDQTEEDKP
jgi:hypothetical protein